MYQTKSAFSSEVCVRLFTKFCRTFHNSFLFLAAAWALLDVRGVSWTVTLQRRYSDLSAPRKKRVLVECLELQLRMETRRQRKKVFNSQSTTHLYLVLCIVFELLFLHNYIFLSTPTN